MQFFTEIPDITEAARLYNTIRPLENQQHDVSPSTLSALGTIFVRHHMHINFGICLVHRHYDIAPGCVMVHTKYDDGSDLCRPEAIGLRAIRPWAYFLVPQDEFLPFEYDSDTAQKHLALPDGVFLSELSSYLRAQGLEDVLGLMHISPSSSRWSEALSFDQRGTIARRISTDEYMLEGIITEWAFDDFNGEVRIKSLKECRKPESGGHARDHGLQNP